MKDQALYEILQMIPVEPGTFMMGPSENNKITLYQGMQRSVTLTRSFEMGRFPVTNFVWGLVLDEPCKGDPFQPKTKVSWVDAQNFLRKLNNILGLPQAVKGLFTDYEKIDLNSPGFRLPTEAEWEYCCRAGSSDNRYGEIDDIAWFRSGDFETVETNLPKTVGLKLPNQWGFYDMLGNVWEYCWDRFIDTSVEGVAPTGPPTSLEENERKVKPINRQRAKRGGSRFSCGNRILASTRAPFQPGCFTSSDVGFRLARTLPSE